MEGGPMPAGPYNLTAHDPGRITWTNTRLIRAIQVAYDVRSDKIDGPDWLGNETYNILANVPAGTTVAQFRVMVQNLLAERFGLRVHHQTKEISGYFLETAKSGLKIRESKPLAGADNTGQSELKRDANPLVVVDETGYPAPRPGNTVYLPGAGFSATIAVNGKNRATVLNEPMAEIALFFGAAVGAPVTDRTGLNGKYDFRLEYAPNGSATAVDAASDPAPGLFDSVEAQLGLKLVRGKVPEERLVVDHVEKVPTEN
jgi:uncharacterized protein (TIGR03435 family)